MLWSIVTRVGTSIIDEVIDMTPVSNITGALADDVCRLHLSPHIV